VIRTQQDILGKDDTEHVIGSVAGSIRDSVFRNPIIPVLKRYDQPVFVTFNSNRILDGVEVDTCDPSAIIIVIFFKYL
jgi:hypothetical protein